MPCLHLPRRRRYNLCWVKVWSLLSCQYCSNFKVAYDPISNQKAPKVLSDAILWMNTALIEFGIAGLTLRALIDFLKVALQNSNAAVRTSATKTLVTLKLFAGPS